MYIMIGCCAKKKGRGERGERGKGLLSARDAVAQRPFRWACVWCEYVEFVVAMPYPVEGPVENKIILYLSLTSSSPIHSLTHSASPSLYVG